MELLIFNFFLIVITELSSERYNIFSVVYE